MGRGSVVRADQCGDARGIEDAKAWVIAMAVAAVLSAVHVSVSTGGDVGGGFAPSALSGVLIALIWLPALLRIVALAGGGSRRRRARRVPEGYWR
jgi:hypothetical protein